MSLHIPVSISRNSNFYGHLIVDYDLYIIASAIFSSKWNELLFNAASVFRVKAAQGDSKMNKQVETQRETFAEKIAPVWV